MMILQPIHLISGFRQVLFIKLIELIGLIGLIELIGKRQNVKG